MWFGLFSIGTIFKLIVLGIVIYIDAMLFQDNVGLGILFVFMELMLYMQFRNRGFGILRSGTGNNGNYGRQGGFAPQNEAQGLDIMLRLMELEAQNRNNANLIRNQQGHGENSIEKKPVYLSEEHRVMRNIFEVE